MRKFRNVLLILAAMAWLPIPGNDAHAQGTKVIDQVITWYYSPNQYGGYGFYWWHRNEGGYNIINYGSMSTTDWSNYYNGEFTMRFEVIEQPTDKPFLVEFGIWQRNPSGGHRAELIAPRHTIPGGAGSVWSGSIGSPNTWWVHPDGPGPVDFSSPETFDRLGLVLRNPNPFCIPAGPEWGVPGACPEYQGNFFTMKARVTIYAFPGGTPPTNYTTTFNVKDESSANINAANISINGSNLTTNSSGQASVSLPNGTYNYTVSKSGYTSKTGSVTVSGGNVTENVTLASASVPEYTVTFNVKDESSANVSGANISVNGTNLTTNSSGQATINLPNGSYNYTVSKTGYDNTNGSVTISGANKSENVTLNESASGSGSTVKFELKMEKYNIGVSGATISINGTDLSSDSNGEASLNLEDGTYPYTIVRSGFEDVSGEVVVSGSNVTRQHTLLFALYPVTFTVSDGASNKVQGATITIPDVQKTKDEGGNIVHNVAEVSKTTDANGQAVFELMNDSYNYTVSKSGYGDKTGSVFVSGKGEDVAVALSQTGYTLKFVVKDGSNNSVEGASVSVDGKSLTTNASGEASTVINDGTYNYTVSKSGYDNANSSVTISGADKSENVTLNAVVVPDPEYTLTFNVKDGSAAAIEGAAIAVNGSNLSTDAAGQAGIDLPDGTYNYTVSKSGYDNANGSVTISGADKSENVTLNAVVVPDPEYTVTFELDMEKYDMKVSGATIFINDVELITDSNGKASIELENGTYPYTIVRAGFEDINGEVVVSDADVSKQHTLLFALYTVTFTITDGASNPVPGAVISIPDVQKTKDDGGNIVHGVAELSKTTDASGQAIFYLMNDTYGYTVSKTGYGNASGSVFVSGEDKSVNESISQANYTVNFVVKDGNANPVQGASISINSGTLTTNSSGEASLSLNAGSYPYTVSASGYQQAGGTVVVSSANLTENVSLILITYAVTFSVNSDGSPVSGANIEVNGGNLTTNESGQATVNLTPGSYNYSVSGEGYAATSGSVEVVDEDVNESVSMSAVTYTISFAVKDMSDNPVEGASISVNELILTTDAGGIATTTVTGGSYNYTVSKDNFLDNNGAFAANSDITINITLQSTVNTNKLFSQDDIEIISLNNAGLRIKSRGAEFKPGYIFSIYNLAGKQIFNYENETESRELLFTLNEGTKGIFILQIKDKNSFVFSDKFWLK